MTSKWNRTRTRVWHKPRTCSASSSTLLRTLVPLSPKPSEELTYEQITQHQRPFFTRVTNLRFVLIQTKANAVDVSNDLRAFVTVNKPSGYPPPRVQYAAYDSTVVSFVASHLKSLMTYSVALRTNHNISTCRSVLRTRNNRPLQPCPPLRLQPLLQPLQAASLAAHWASWRRKTRPARTSHLKSPKVRGHFDTKVLTLSLTTDWWLF